MFEKIKEKLAELAKHHNKNFKVDTSQFNDPVADEISWSPLKKGGASFKTHNLVQKTQNLMQYKLSIGGMVFMGIFAIIGLAVAIMGLGFILNSQWMGFFMIFFGAIFTGAAYLMYRFMGKPVIFDSQMGCLWVGHKQPKLAGDNNTQDKLVYFSNIHAIQIIKERIRGNKTTYSSYEINLVLKDGTRFNIIDHGSHSQILIDAETLSVFIGKPIWNIS